MKSQINPTGAPTLYPAGIYSDDPPSARAADGCSFSVAQCVGRMTALFAFQRELLRTEAAWMAGVPYWDAKQRISDHVLADARGAEAMLKRLHELKASAAERQQIAGIEELVGDLAGTRSADEWLRGLYRLVKPWLRAQFDEYLRGSDPVMDRPSREVVRWIQEELDRQVAWFRSFAPRHSEWEQPDTSGWEAYVASVLKTARLSGDAAYPEAERPRRPPGHPVFKGVEQVRRDSTFNVRNAAPYPREGGTYLEQRFLVFYHHTQEMQFAESLGAILFETGEMPWAYHLDLARHMADEVRHATMGQARLEQLGISLAEIPMLTQHYAFRSKLNPLERFCLMTLVQEATAFERKRANVELFEAHDDPISALYETYDIRDEMLHANLGHVWVPILLRVYHDSRAVSELVEHCRGMISQIINEYPSSADNMLKR
jgi:hypothetical protein